MKKLLPVACIALLSLSCSKSVKYCWECRSNVATNSADLSYRDVGCDKTKKDLKASVMTDYSGNEIDVDKHCRIKK